MALAVFGLCREAWRPWAAAAFAQVQRSALSAQLNIAEGYAYGTRASFSRFLRYAYGSAVETTDLLVILHDAGLCTDDAIRPIVARSKRSQALILGLLKSQERQPLPSTRRP